MPEADKAECPVCDGAGGWRIPGTRDCGTCASCSGTGSVAKIQRKRLLDQMAKEAEWLRDRIWSLRRRQG